MNDIICGNSDVILKQMVEDGIKIDLVLTDQPYNIGKDFEKMLIFLL